MFQATSATTAATAGIKTNNGQDPHVLSQRFSEHMHLSNGAPLNLQRPTINSAYTESARKSLLSPLSTGAADAEIGISDYYSSFDSQFDGSELLGIRCECLNATAHDEGCLHAIGLSMLEVASSRSGSTESSTKQRRVITEAMSPVHRKTLNNVLPTPATTPHALLSPIGHLPQSVVSSAAKKPYSPRRRSKTITSFDRNGQMPYPSLAPTLVNISPNADQTLMQAPNWYNSADFTRPYSSSLLGATASNLISGPSGIAHNMPPRIAAPLTHQLPYNGQNVNLPRTLMMPIAEHSSMYYSNNNDSLPALPQIQLPTGQQQQHRRRQSELPPFIFQTEGSENSSTTQQEEQLFHCEFPGCDRSFSRFYNMKSHQRCHTGERPYVCDEPGCEASFSRNHDLKRHKRVHSGVRPYRCVDCQKTFSRMDALSRHVRMDKETRERLVDAGVDPTSVSGCSAVKKLAAPRVQSVDQQLDLRSFEL